MKIINKLSFVSLCCGILFGIGMQVSGMVLPEKVLGFLDVTGEWDISLAFVMGGALAVFLPCYQFIIKGRSHSLIQEPMNLPTKSQIDPPLIIGAICFGIGWGLAGICPAPALTSLAAPHLKLILFIVMLALGQFIARQVKTKYLNP